MSTKATENGLVWDMHTQVAKWVRSTDASNPFLYGASASQAKRLYAWGYSQTGGFLFTYINAIQPLVVAKDGKPWFCIGASGGRRTVKSGKIVLQCLPHKRNKL